MLLGCLLVAAGVSAQEASPEAALEEALGLMEAGETKRARERLEAVVETWPKYSAAHYYLGRLAFDRGDLERSWVHLDRAASGTFPRAFSARFYLGRVRALFRDFGGAVSAFDGSLQLAPRYVPALIERGRAKLFLGDADAGLADLEAGLALSDKVPKGRILAIQLLLALGRTAEAATLIESLTAAETGDTPPSIRVEWLRWAAEGSAESRLALNRAVDADPQAGDLYWALAHAWSAVDRSRAAELYRVALDHDSENPVSFYSLGGVVAEGERVVLPAAMPGLLAAMERATRLWQGQQFDQARELSQRLLEQRSRLVPMRLLLAREAERQQDLWRAMEIYQRLLEQLGPVPGIGRDLAQVAQTMGATEIADCAVRMSLAADPGDARLHYLSSAIEVGRGNDEAAIAALREALRLGSTDVRVWLRLGELHFERMEISESLDAYREAMTVDPGAAEAVRSFALSSLTTEQYADLRRVLELQIEAQPDNINTLYSLGVMNLRDNRLDEALRVFLRLAELAPDHRQVHYNLGQIYLRQGDREKGQQEMERFRQLKAAEDLEWESHNQAHFRRLEARRLSAAGDPAGAVPLYEQSVREGTAELVDYLELAAANLAAGHLQAAHQGYAGILQADPYLRQAWEGRLQTSEQLGDEVALEEARRKLEVLDWSCKIVAIDGRGES